jgi:hypothetical protein
MSYLDVPRIHFFGQFLANPGTVNNILSNFDPHSPTIPLWNPRGVALFQFQGKNVNGTQLSGVSVMSVMDSSGHLVTHSSQDALVGATVLSNTGTPAKLVDLDPSQQLVSQIFGLQLQVAIGGAGGAGFATKSGEWLTVPNLTDLWFVRNPQGGPSGIFQTVIQANQIEWNNPDASPLLYQFQQACHDGISVKFAVDLYDLSNASPTFTIGRVAGAFGPASDEEPVRFPTRKLVPQVPDGGNPQDSAFWSAPFAVDAGRSKAVFDIGNSFQVQQNPKTGAPESVPVGTATAVVVTGGGTISLSPSLNYQQSQYQLTAGIVEVDLTPDQLTAISGNPAGIVVEAAGSDPVLAEAAPYVNLSPMFMRLSPGEQGETELRAYRYGQPLANERLDVELLFPGFFAQNFPQYPGLDQQLDPDINQPAAGITLETQSGGSGGTGFVETDGDGIARLRIKANVPQPLPESREFIDSQVYFISGPWQGSAWLWWPMSFAPLSVLVFDEYDIPSNPTWGADVRPVMDQYMRMYPGMKSILDMSDYNTVKQNANALKAVFSADILDPARMPVTRDLAPAKLQMVLKWISDGMPQ